MKMLKSLLVVLTVLGIGNTAAAGLVADARRRQAEETAAQTKEEVQKLLEAAIEEKIRVRTDVLIPFGDDFQYLTLETKYKTALDTINKEIKQAKRNLSNAKRALEAFQNDYKKNPMPYLQGVTKFPAFNIPALESVVEFTQKIKAQLEAARTLKADMPALLSAEVTEA